MKAPPPTLIQRTGRAAFWNAVLVPLQAILSLAFGMIVAQRFGLNAGVYVTGIGVATSAVMFTGMGIPTSLTKFLPEIEASSGAAAVAMFLRRVAAFRILLLAVVITPLNLFAQPLAAALDMGTDGVVILRLASVLIVARAVVDLCVRTLNAFFGQLRSNVLSLIQGSLDLVLVGAAAFGGFQVGGVFGMVVVSSVITAAVGLFYAHGMLASLPADERGSAFAPADIAATRALVAAERSRFAGFAVFTYLFELSIYFSDKAFATPALALVLGRNEAAIFSYGFSLAFMTVGLMIASFRGLYRPMFAHLRARRDPEQLRRAFSGISKAQLVLLMPAGVGLFVMAGDYIPLLYGAQFTPAVPVARVFVALLYLQTAFNLGIIWLSIDERYRAVLWAQSIQVFAVPFFLIVADTRGLVAAALLFGSARVVVNVVAYVLCHRDYGFRFPWAFAAKVAAVASVMGLILSLLRSFLAPSVPEALGLTTVGVLLYAAGLRVARVLGPEEVDLLERSDIPGTRAALAWLVAVLPRSRGRLRARGGVADTRGWSGDVLSGRQQARLQHHQPRVAHLEALHGRDARRTSGSTT